MENDADDPSSQSQSESLGGESQSQSLLSTSRQSLKFPASATIDGEIEEPFPSLSPPQMTSTPAKSQQTIHRGKQLQEKPLTEADIQADPKSWMRSMFELRVIEADGSNYYQCVRCLPRKKLLRVFKDTYQHLEKHLLTKAHTVKDFEDFKKLKDKRHQSDKRPSSPSSSCSSSKRAATTGPDSYMHRLYTQKDADYDTVIDIVMNEHSFQVTFFYFTSVWDPESTSIFKIFLPCFCNFTLPKFRLRIRILPKTSGSCPFSDPK